MIPTQKMISNLIQIELAYINTSHPDFIGGKQVTHLFNVSSLFFLTFLSISFTQCFVSLNHLYCVLARSSVSCGLSSKYKVLYHVDLAERSKALESGSSPKGREFKSHSRHRNTLVFLVSFVIRTCHGVGGCILTSLVPVLRQTLLQRPAPICCASVACQVHAHRQTGEPFCIYIRIIP